MSKETFTKRYRLPYTHDLPSEWNYVEIGKVFKESNENNRPDLPLYSVTRTKGIIPQEENNKRDTSSSDKSKYKVIHPGDIVYNTMRMWQGVVALSNVEGIVSPAYTVCTPTEDVYGKYAEYLFKTHPMIKLFHRFSQGLVDDTLSLKYENFKKIFMPLPPFSEQRKIAAILSTVDEAIEKTEAIIEQTEKVKKGLMQQLLTKGIGHTKFKKTEIGEIPEEWEVRRLEEICEIRYGKSPKGVKVEYSDYPIMGTSGHVGYAKEFLFSGPMILVGRKGTIDKPIYIERDCWIIDTAYGLFADQTKVSLKWLYYFLTSYDLASLNEATGVPSLNRNSLYSIKVPLPSLNEQNKISNILTSIEQKIETEKEKLSIINEIKKGLMQSLLTGKVRVKVDEDEVVSS